MKINVIVTPFETVELSEEVGFALSQIKGEFNDKRTKRGKHVEKIVNVVTELSEIAYMYGLDDVTQIFSDKN